LPTSLQLVQRILKDGDFLVRALFSDLAWAFFRTFTRVFLRLLNRMLSIFDLCLSDLSRFVLRSQAFGGFYFFHKSELVQYTPGHFVTFIYFLEVLLPKGASST
jgi:hypothetical protein